jgi:hypothetical protein
MTVTVTVAVTHLGGVHFTFVDLIPMRYVKLQAKK